MTKREELREELREEGLVVAYAERSTISTQPIRGAQFLLRQKGMVVLAILAGLARSISSFLLTVCIGEFFVLQFKADGTKSRLLHLLGIQINEQGSFFLFFFSVLVIRVASGFMESFVAAWLGEKFSKDVRERLFFSQMNAPVERFTRKPYGHYLLRYSGDLRSIQQLITKGVLGTVKDGLFMMVGVLVVYSIHPFFALLLIVSLFAGMAFMLGMARLHRNTISNSRNQKSLLLSAVTRSFSRFKKVKEAGTVPAEVAGFMNRSKEVFGANIRYQQRTVFATSLVPLFQFGLIGAVLWFAAGNHSLFSYSEVIQVVLVLLLLQGTFRRLLKTPGTIAKGRLSLNKINALISG